MCCQQKKINLPIVKTKKQSQPFHTVPLRSDSCELARQLQVTRTMNLIDEAKKVFEVPRPKYFMGTPPYHCEECEEVERKAQKNTPDTLTIQEAGDGYASLHCFLNTEGFLYYFHVFTRFSINPEVDDNTFFDNLLFAITYRRNQNEIYKACNQEQRELICKFIVWYQTEFPEIIENYMLEEVEEAMNIWACNRVAGGV